ncbi:MAG: GGDEF domain-containing phosphodiesterase [Planctomycetota bacterium]
MEQAPRPDGLVPEPPTILRVGEPVPPYVRRTLEALGCKWIEVNDPLAASRMLEAESSGNVLAIVSGAEALRACFDGLSTQGGSHDSDDPSTGLPGREQFLVRLEQGLVHAGRRRHPVACMCVEYTNFTELTQNMSPGTLSEFVGTVAEGLKSCLRGRDVLCRLPQESQAIRIGSFAPHRFGVIIEIEREHDASVVARRLLDSVSLPIEVDGVEVRPTFCVGIAVHPEDAITATELWEAAEKAVAAAREEGPSTVQYFNSSMNARAFQQISMERALERALEEEQFEVFYQPKVQISDEKIVGMEALVRWRHPELGLISPAQFVPVAEETGLIVDIGRWVLERSCRDAKKWTDDGLTPVVMAVNLSPRQFRDPSLFKDVLATVERTGLPADQLELELTESMLMENADEAVKMLRALKQHGIKISIDDFGTGYSSLSYLKRFPIDALKIDRSFINEVNTNPDDASIATSIILMGRSLRLKVIAEGVETRNQLSFLRVMQCDQVQGYLFSPPVPEPKARELIVENMKAAGAPGSSRVA